MYGGVTSTNLQCTWNMSIYSKKGNEEVLRFMSLLCMCKEFDNFGVCSFDELSG